MKSRPFVPTVMLAITMLLAACESELPPPSQPEAEAPKPLSIPAEELLPSEPQRVAVPDVTGLRLSSARRAAQRIGLRLLVVKKPSDEAPGTILNQHPLPGSSRTPGSIIRVTVVKPRPEPEPEAQDCQGYSPCIPPGPDVDCAGGSGDGPRYTGPVTVTGSDPYGLDADGDGYGCE